jgi:hypothetical protein
MPPHTCPICLKVFAQKGDYDSHKARKWPCKKDDAALSALVEAKAKEVLGVPTENVVVDTR